MKRKTGDYVVWSEPRSWASSMGARQGLRPGEWTYEYGWSATPGGLLARDGWSGSSNFASFEAAVLDAVRHVVEARRSIDRERSRDRQDRISRRSVFRRLARGEALSYDDRALLRVCGDLRDPHRWEYASDLLDTEGTYLGVAEDRAGVRLWPMAKAA